ncbi:MAG TPA: hypothetical protein VNH18_33285 [Bryobacteraceae bacterium]|nr:hypothetical protein [Bryobacteraceae bacterium]
MFTSATPGKYDPQYTAAAARGAEVGASFATLRGLDSNRIPHGIHKGAIGYARHLRLQSADQTWFLARAYEAAAHQAYNESLAHSS